MRVTLQPAFILHSRAYKETSLLLEVFTRDFGRISLIARGVRKPRSILKAILQPFSPLFISWQGKTELMTLSHAEVNKLPILLRGESLLSGLYLNEILVRILHKHDSYPKLYTVYEKTLVELQTPTIREKILRLFEKCLLEELGYGLQWDKDFSSGQLLEADKYYRFYPEYGFKQCAENCAGESLVFLGKSLIALSKEDLTDMQCLRDAKRLMRIALTPILGSQPLQSRKLFLEVERK